jgi:leader peptidase (prepilin peptidase) / N-methyltransferase
LNPRVDEDLGGDQVMESLVATEPLFQESEAKEYRRSKKRRIRTNWYLVWLTLGLLAAWAICTFALPPLERAIRIATKPSRAKYEMTLSFPMREVYQTFKFLICLWIFYIGASIGSFLNVVAGRVPASRGIVFGGSRCPFCETKLSFLENMPIFGWLYCKGRCRTCRLPIATRYLWMEVVVGTLFLAIAARQLFLGGGNLPGITVKAWTGIVYTVMFPDWNLIVITCAHSMLFAVLVMLTAVNLDKQVFPWRAIAVIAALFVVAMALAPQLQLVNWYRGISTASPVTGTNRSIINWLLNVVVGGLVGWSVGQLTAMALQKNSTDYALVHWVQSSFLIGVLLGWQATVVIDLTAVFLVGIVRAIKAKRPSEGGVDILWALIGAVFVHHVFWAQIAGMIKLV